MMDGATAASRDLLAVHKTVAKFAGLQNRPCRFMTALCPDRCGHGGSVAKFTVVKYLHYERCHEDVIDKPETFTIQMSFAAAETGLTPERKTVLESLAAGDFVSLAWNHDYVHYQFDEGGSTSAPERPLTELKKLSADEAKQLTA